MRERGGGSASSRTATEETQPLVALPDDPVWDPTFPTRRGGECVLGSYRPGADARLESALSQLGVEHKPAEGWDQRVMVLARARASRAALRRRRGGR